MNRKTLKRNAIVVGMITDRIFQVKLENGKEVLGILSNKIGESHPNLAIGDCVVVLSNPYEDSRVKIHADTWGKR